MQRITTFLWFDKQAEEAAKFYCSVFKDSKILGVTRHLEGSGVGKGDVLTVQFRLGDQEYYWETLLAGGGKESACGWLKDKYGLSWQVTPTILLEMVADKDRKKAQRAFDAMLQMRKIEIKKLKEAYDG
jgi:predicted 3-demethylubiquinone-9 3-methyltransferase (glyoxalase superfamily)